MKTRHRSGLFCLIAGCALLFGNFSPLLPEWAIAAAAAVGLIMLLAGVPLFLLE